MFSIIMREVIAVAALLPILASCASTGQLPSSSASGQVGNITLQNGQLFPAKYVIWNDPAAKQAAPKSDALWRAGDRIAVNHCLYMDDSGGVSRLTLGGLLNM